MSPNGDRHVFSFATASLCIFSGAVVKGIYLHDNALIPYIGVFACFYVFSYFILFEK
jgi:hypothetical protein